MNETNIPMRLEPRGFFTLSTNLRGKIAEFENLILDNGLNMLAKGTDFMYCWVGRGSAAPLTTDTDLVSFAATSSSWGTDYNVANSPPYYAYTTYFYRFNAGVAVGNLSEIAVGSINVTTRSLFCRSLIKDSFGNPTTITLLPSEILDVTYELRHYIPTVDSVGTITLGGNIGGTYDFVLRASGVTSKEGPNWPALNSYSRNVYDYALASSGDISPSITSGPSTAPLSPASSGSSAPYVTDSHQVTVSYTWGTNTANFDTGIKSIKFALGIGSYQVGFTPAIPKTLTDSLTLTFSNSWARKT